MTGLLLVALGFSHATQASSLSSFLVMGDWGGEPRKPYHTASEVDTASGMNAIARKLGANFALTLGDNFYYDGVKSVSDPRFHDTFESVFTGDAVSSKNGFKFHVVAGNHDHRGEINAQIEYSNVSSRWMYPSLYYTFTKIADDNSTMQFVMLDTVVIAGNSQLGGADDQLAGDQLPGPSDQDHADKQIQWLEDTLRQSKADYVIVAGHYPVHSVCEHGPTSILQNTVKPLLQKYKVSAYLAGHDHCAEHIDVGDGVQYHGIGSAAYHSKSLKHKHTVMPSQLKYHDATAGGGFASIVISRGQMVVVHHDDMGKHLYNSTIAPRSETVAVVV